MSTSVFGYDGIWFLCGKHFLEHSATAKKWPKAQSMPLKSHPKYCSLISMLEIVAQVAARVEKTAQLQIGHW